MFGGNFNSESMTRTRSYTYLITISCSFHLENVFQLCTGLDHSCQGNVIVIELGSWLVSQIVHDVMPCTCMWFWLSRSGWLDWLSRHELVCQSGCSGKLQQQVVATYHSVCAGRASTICSCSNTSWWHVAGTNYFVHTGEFFWKSLSLQQNSNVVIVTSHTNSVWFDFLQQVMLLWQNSVEETDFGKKFQYTRTDLSLRWVPATCCYNLSPSVIIKSFKSNPHYLLVSLSQLPC